MLKHLQFLYNKRLEKFGKLLQEIPNDKLWNTFDDSVNSAGILAQHVAGNLHHYIGVGMGDSIYQRNRTKEFTNTGASCDELLQKINEAAAVIDDTIEALTEEDLNASFPLEFPHELTNGEMLIHLMGHLEYHSGQLDYLHKLLYVRK